MVYCHICLWCNCNLPHQPPKYIVFRLSGSITCCILLGAASKALTCNQRPACLCQGSTVNCQLTKDWKECVLGLVRGGFSQQESSGVFLSMGHNGFSPPMKHYSGWRAGPPATWEPFPQHPPPLSEPDPAITGDLGQMEGWGEDGLREEECERTMNRSRW